MHLIAVIVMGWHSRFNNKKRFHYSLGYQVPAVIHGIEQKDKGSRCA